MLAAPYSTHSSRAVLEWTSAQPDSFWYFLLDISMCKHPFCISLHLFNFSLGVDPGWARLEVGHDLARQDFVRLSTGHNFLDPIFGQFVPIG